MPLKKHQNPSGGLNEAGRTRKALSLKAWDC